MFGPSARNAQHTALANVGIQPLARIGGAYVSVARSVLDDLSPAELAAAPVRYTNGRDDDWFHEPAETRHL